MIEMTGKEKTTYEWALKQSNRDMFANRAAKVLAEYIKRNSNETDTTNIEQDFQLDGPQHIREILLWGKPQWVSYDKEQDTLHIDHRFVNKCLKCSKPYPEQKHGSYFVCPGCDARFRFFGAGYPQVVKKTKGEVIYAAMIAGWNIFDDTQGGDE